MSNHIFLDLETLDLRPSAVFFQLAAVEFNPQSFEIGKTLDLDLCADDQVMRGRTIDEATIDWHVQQGNHIKMAEGLSLIEAFDALDAYIAEVNPDRVWIWGADFDRPILDDAAAMLDREVPWKYHAIMDGRTIWSWAFPTTRRPKRPHAALGDCLASINDLRTALTKLNLVEADSYV